MEDTYEKLRKDGKNTVDCLVQWLQDANLVEKEKEAETKAQKLFEEAKDKTNVEFECFKGVVRKLSEEQKKTFEEVAKSLTQQAPKFMEALRAAAAAAAAAFEESLKKK